MKQFQITLTLYEPTSQNGQTHSNNSLAKKLTNSSSVFDHFVGLAVKRKTIAIYNYYNFVFL